VDHGSHSASEQPAFVYGIRTSPLCEDWIESARQRVEVWEVEDIGPMALAEIADKVQRTVEVVRQRTMRRFIATRGFRSRMSNL
jgi:hypothetical protein